MKKISGNSIICLALTASVVLSLAPAFHVLAKTTKEKLQEAERQHQETTGKLNETKDNINKLNDVKSGLQQKLNNLNEQLTEVSSNLADLEEKIEIKQEEIKETDQDLQEAIVAQDTQYANMKKRIQFIYEKKQDMLMDMVFSSGSFAEMLNRNSYIEQLTEYDRNQLEEFKEIRRLVEETKQKLEQEKQDLDKYHSEVKSEQAKVTGYVKETSGSIGQYSNEIASAEAVANQIAAQAKLEEQNIAALKKKLEEEIAMSRLAAKSAKRDISEVEFQEGDRYLLANLIYCEAGNQPYAGQLAVGAVVINRVLSSVYPDTVVGVIYANKQFSPVGDGHLALALAQNRATASCYQAADEAMQGHTNVGNCVYFRTPIEGLTGIQIGDHIFY